jgi:uncharacterized protein YjbJ (UPF0337 family)
VPASPGLGTVPPFDVQRIDLALSSWGRRAPFLLMIAMTFWNPCGAQQKSQDGPPLLPVSRSTGVQSMDKPDIEDRAASLVGRTEAAVGDLARDAKSQVEGLATQATATAEHAYGQARDQVRGAAAAVTTSVEKQPLVALLTVGLICGAVGFLLARR